MRVAPSLAKISTGTLHFSFCVLILYKYTVRSCFRHHLTAFSTMSIWATRQLIRKTGVLSDETGGMVLSSIKKLGCWFKRCKFLLRVLREATGLKRVVTLHRFLTSFSMHEFCVLILLLEPFYIYKKLYLVLPCSLNNLKPRRVKSMRRKV